MFIDFSELDQYYLDSDDCWFEYTTFMMNNNNKLSFDNSLRNTTTRLFFDKNEEKKRQNGKRKKSLNLGVGKLVHSISQKRLPKRIVKEGTKMGTVKSFKTPKRKQVNSIEVRRKRDVEKLSQEEIREYLQVNNDNDNQLQEKTEYQQEKENNNQDQLQLQDKKEYHEKKKSRYRETAFSNTYWNYLQKITWKITIYE